MIYDGDCGFCKLWIARWRGITGELVEYRPSREVAAEFPEIPAEDFAGSVQFIDVEGRRHQKTAAVFRALAPALGMGRALVWAHQWLPGFGPASDRVYDVVARHRMLFSRLTRVLWGNDVTRPAYAVSTTIFLRLLGLIYLGAFASFGAQARGLVGEHGILPIRETLPLVAGALGSDAWHQWPTLLWLNSSDAMLFGVTWVGLGGAALVLLGVMQPLALAVAWAAYLSLVVAGQDFFSFQWDGLLLETGLLAIFAAPWSWRPGFVVRRPPELAHFALIFLLFRLMFSSGVVKLSSGDPTWANLSALEFHYFTQPLPNVGAWFAAQAPAWFQRISCGFVLGVELGLPFLVFLPRRLRLVAGGGFAALQILILLTGNYGFFNLLALALTLLLVDDATWPRRFRILADGRPDARGMRFLLPPVVIAYVALSAVPLATAFRRMPPWLQPVANVYGQTVAPFRSINGYGLFAVMTTARPEITFEGSADGVTWKPYAFKFKPGAASRSLPGTTFSLPRLDWMLWFAAMEPAAGSPWITEFVRRLLEARPEVLALMGKDPFEGKPPRFIRGRLDRYEFTSFAERRKTGEWWRRTSAGNYFLPVSPTDFQR